MLNRKKVYRFSDEIMAVDTIISFLFGIPSLLCILFSVIYSIVLKGKASDFIGYLLLAAFIMAVTAFVFGLLSYKSQDGGVLTKRTSMIISLIDIAAIVVLYIL
jgi:hypothetical protein